MNKKLTKTQLARKQLMELSCLAKQFIKNGHEDLTVNEALLMMYSEGTEAAEFKTFKQWKEAGYSVIKGQIAYRIWGKPLKASKQQPDNPDEQKEYKLWPMCCLFSNLQVEPLQE